jgi:protocatechuate 3,4-dioxygenase alpha subunit
MLIHAVTRLYFEDESATVSDRLLSAIDPARRQTLIAQREAYGDLTCYRLDIHLQGDRETVFFDA